MRWFARQRALALTSARCCRLQPLQSHRQKLQLQQSRRQKLHQELQQSRLRWGIMSQWLMLGGRRQRQSRPLATRQA